MGATNEIKETNLSLQLDDKQCPQCQQVFTQAEIDNQNYEVWFDTTNDVRLTPISELTEDAYYKPFGRTGYEFTIWIRSIEHECCPATELCKGCYQRFLTEKMTEINDNHYCSPCHQELTDQEIRKENHE